MVDQTQQRMEGGQPGTYPARPGEPDCVYYLQHGLCGYGPRCHFNHPPLSSNLCVDQGGRQFPERFGQPDCQYYLKTGLCKFGAACKFHHPRDRVGSPVQLNLSGLPLRLGERECIYYTRTGACKFGLNCKFHHPRPGENCSFAVSVPSSPVYALNAYSSLNSFCGNPPTYVMASGSYLPGLEIPATTNYTPFVLSPDQWAFKGLHSPKTPLDGIEQSPTVNNKTSIVMYSKSRASALCQYEFPERQGQPECQYYLKTGDCRFGAFCKFHHPKDQTALASPSKCELNVIGLPLRPGEPHCSYYMQYGICKFGPLCKFDHPTLVPLYNTMGVAPLFNMRMGMTCGSSGPKVNSTIINACAADTVLAASLDASREKVQQDANCITVSAHEESSDSRN